jgi:hypothetical protein
VTVVCAASRPIPPVLTPSAMATMEARPYSPFWGMSAAQKSSLLSLLPASEVNPMSTSNAMHHPMQDWAPPLVPPLL